MNSKFYSLFNKDVKLQAFEYLKELIKALIEEAKQILESQSYNWVPLTERYADYKMDHGLDDRILIATGFYRDHIGWGVTHNKIWFGVPNITHEPSGLPLPVLARIHEFGTATIPARPLWRPLLSKYAREAPNFAKRYKKEVKKAADKAKSSLFKARKAKVTL
jgi:hypothetical protein